MKLLKFFSDEILNVSAEPDGAQPFTREAARGIIVDGDGKIALLYTEKHGHHKLPGGGIDPEDTSWQQALEREAKEEAGAIIRTDNIVEVGMTIEHLEALNSTQVSYCGIAYATGKGETELTASEIADGFRPPKWVTSEEALQLFAQDKPKTYKGVFMHARDQVLLQAGVKKLLEQ